MNDASPADHLAQPCRLNKANLELDRGGELAGFQRGGHEWTNSLIEQFCDAATGYTPSRIEAFWLRCKLNGDGPTLNVNLYAPPSEESGTRGPRQTVADKMPQWIISLVHRSSP